MEDFNPMSFWLGVIITSIIDVVIGSSILIFIKF